MTWLKLIHVSCVIISFAGFVTRSFWILFRPRMLKKKWVKIFPHLIDTILLLSAILLLVQLQLSLLDNHWLLAKIGALLVYIALGLIAFKAGRSARIRWPVFIIAWILAVSVFFYIVSVAVTKSTYGFFAISFEVLLPVILELA